MTLDSLAPLLLGGVAVVLVAVLGVRFAGRLGLPGLLLYLGIGLLIGWLVPGARVTDPEFATVLGYAALVLILAEGGLTTRWSDLRPVLWPSIVLATVGVAVTIVAVAVPLIWLAGMDPRLAILLAAALSATDAAAVFSVLRRVPIAPRLRTLLEGEAGFNDAPVVVFVIAIASGSIDDSSWLLPLLVVGELVGGAAIGIAIGFLARWVMPRLALPAVGLYPIAAIALLVGAYGLADVLHTSGFIAVYVAAVLLGSCPRLPHRRNVLGFSEGLAWIAQIGLFVMLGLLAAPERLPGVIGIAAVATVALIVLGRPLAAVVSVAPFRWPWRSIGFVSVAGLRGAVPIVFAAIPLGLGMPGAEIVFDATLAAVLVLTIVQTPLLPWIGRKLGIEEPGEPTELDVDSAPLDEMDAAVLNLEVRPDGRLVGMYVRELGLPKGAVASLLVRQGEGIVPDAETRLRAGDRLLVVAVDEVRDAAEGRLRAVARDGRLATWRQGGGLARRGDGDDRAIERDADREADRDADRRD